MRRVDRLGLILDQVGSNGSTSVEDLAQQLGVSGATVRRDLRLLADQRLLSRTHGGAVGDRVSYELPLRYRGGQRSEQKRRIAATAAQLVAEGSTVGITGGTTTTEVARALASRQELTIVTNAINIAAQLAVRPNLRLVVTGGIARAASYELVGPMAEDTISSFNLDVVLLGVDGIEAAAGCTTHDGVEAHTNAVLVERSQRTIVVADSSKIGRVAFARICALGDVDALITDTAADPTAVAVLRDAGVEVSTV